MERRNYSCHHTGYKLTSSALQNGNRLFYRKRKVSFTCHITELSWLVRVSRIVDEMYCGHPRLFVCLTVSLSVYLRLHAYAIVICGVVEDAPCAVLGGFAIGARVALLWQHNANAKC